MIHMRIHLSYTFAVSLAQAITIALRYAAIRFQGQNPNGYIFYFKIQFLSFDLLILSV